MGTGLHIIRLYADIDSKFSFTNGILDSDQLFSSVVERMGDVERVKESIFSSAFPFVEKGNKVVYFLPFRMQTIKWISPEFMAHISKTPENVDEYTVYKQFKNVRFVPHDFYTNPPRTMEEFIKRFVVSGSFIIPIGLLPDDIVAPFVRSPEIHNFICRYCNETQFFEREFIRFYSDRETRSGMWFLTDFEYDTWQNLEYGGEIGMGAGKFWRFKKTKNPFNGNKPLLVSLLKPTGNVSNDVSFRLKTRIVKEGNKYMIIKRLLVEEGYLIPSKDVGEVIVLGNKLLYGRGVYIGI